MIILEMVLNDLVQRYDITIFFDELKMKEAILTVNWGQNLSSTNMLNESQYRIDGI